MIESNNTISTNPPSPTTLPISKERIEDICTKYQINLSEVLYLNDITTAKARRLTQEVTALIIDPSKNEDAQEIARKIASIRPMYLFFTQEKEDTLIPADYSAVKMDNVTCYQFNDRFQKTFRALESLEKKLDKIPSWFMQDFFDKRVLAPIMNMGIKLKKRRDTGKIEEMLGKLKKGETTSFQIENLFNDEKIATIELFNAAIKELEEVCETNNPEHRQAVDFLKSKLIKKFPALALSLQGKKSLKQILKAVALFIIKMPALVVVNNMLTLLLPVIAPIFLIFHPLESLRLLLKGMVKITKTISSTPTAWTKIGSGMVGFAVGEMLIHLGPMEGAFMLLGILLMLVGIIGSMVMRAEESAEDGKGAFKGAMEGLLDQLSVIPVSFASAFNLGLFIGFIQGLSPDFIVKHFKTPKINLATPGISSSSK